MQHQPTVTIGIPVYNEERYLAETIESALNQSYKNIKVIISDNNSTDNSFKIALHYSTIDDRVHVFRQKQNIGAIENFKHSRTLCETPYFMWLGGHDILERDCIQVAIDYLEQDPLTILAYPTSQGFDEEGWSNEHFDSDIQSDSNEPVVRMMRILENLERCTAIHGVFRTSVVKEIPFDIDGIDLLVLFTAASYGKLKQTKGQKYFRRIVRKESREEHQARMASYKIGSRSNISDARLKVFFSHLKYLPKNPNLNFNQKRILFEKLLAYFSLKDARFSTLNLITSNFLTFNF